MLVLPSIGDRIVPVIEIHLRDCDGGIGFHRVRHSDVIILTGNYRLRP